MKYVDRANHQIVFKDYKEMRKFLYYHIKPCLEDIGGYDSPLLIHQQNKIEEILRENKVSDIWVLPKEKQWYYTGYSRGVSSFREQNVFTVEDIKKENPIYLKNREKKLNSILQK